MANSTIAPDRQFNADPKVWNSLKQVIKTSSGFQLWQQEQLTQDKRARMALEDQVRCYLRETLETLAY